jgi:hypothetical protein
VHVGASSRNNCCKSGQVVSEPEHEILVVSNVSWHVSFLRSNAAQGGARR